MHLFRFLRRAHAALRATGRLARPSFVPQYQIDSLEAPVSVELDRLGIPTIRARTRLDAVRALGYVTASDRLFQMDLLRREAAGRVAELMGAPALSGDVERRLLGFARVAVEITALLPVAQREALEAYADGVNAFIGGAKVPAVECRLLGYTPECWSASDSILVLLTMFHRLCFDYDSERTVTIMEKTLPPEVVAFLTPDSDCFTTTLIGGADGHRPPQPVPVQALAELRQPRGAHSRTHRRVVASERPPVGSNSWVVAKSKTADGRTILANDMHLSLAVPNVFYRAGLTYADIQVSGVVLPGLPLVLAGSNGHVAWGLTNLLADCLDLVILETNPNNTDEYKTPFGWQRCQSIREEVKIRGGQNYVANIRATVWGPVTETNLVGNQVALRWTALDPHATNLAWSDMERVSSIEEAMDVANRAGGPPLNVMLADAGGRIGWTVSGRLPRRVGFDGIAARSWASGTVGWDGYVPAQEYPRVMDPPQGYLVTANNRTVGSAYPHVLGHNFSNGYRAYRISRCLEEMVDVDEEAMWRLQLDTVCGYYEFYRALALDVLTEDVVSPSRTLGELRTVITRWDGKADVESSSIAILALFHELLREAVFSSYLWPCRQADELFTYAWSNVEAPLRSLLAARAPETLPDPVTYQSWDAFLVGMLERAANLLQRHSRARARLNVRWGELNRSAIAHPLGTRSPWLRWLVNMPTTPLPGCPYSVRVSAPSHGAAMRLVVSPAYHQKGRLHIPCGQSGNPFSPHYDDQHNDWLQGRPLPFVQGAIQRRLYLKPRRGAKVEK